jgi:hypothetical protein
MKQRRSTDSIPTRSQAYEKSLFSALVAALVALVVLKMLLGLVFVASAVVAVVAFVLFFSVAMRMTPRRKE